VAEDFEVTPEHLEAARKVEIGEGDVVFLRTGWARYFENAAKYVNNTRLPGPKLDGAKWLSDKKVFAVGSDTVAFEKVPGMEVHRHLLVDCGIHIIEVLNLEELARDHVHEFLLVAAPMNIRGGTGSPVRPLAFRL